MAVSTTGKGDAFRDAVDGILAAAGFRTSPEHRLKFKKVDNLAVWTQDELEGPVRYIFETKDYDGTLPKQECIEFITEYGSLIKSGDADRAWLVSKNAVSADGKLLVEEQNGLKCFTFLESQRRVLFLDRYLNDLLEERSISRVPEFYVPPETVDGCDLRQRVDEWLSPGFSPPLFVLGSYGKGKSTFALQLAADLARKALDDHSQRVPILVRLGEIVDEQSLDGLIGKVLASRHRVNNYHFEVFRALNKWGRFVVIYDGFDEMKHGMTFNRFNQVLSELMQLDEGDARIIVLGRDTALHDDLEFRSIIGGRQFTSLGREIPNPNRRPYSHETIRGFDLDEAKSFVRRYFPICAEEVAASRGETLDTQWVESRKSEILSGSFDGLLIRPVHAQMLCRIAAYPDTRFFNKSVYELFDTFVHFLLDREISKKGRYPKFGLEVRRRFNSTLAWWLWERSGSTTTTLGDIPLALCREVTTKVAHDFDDQSLKRELIQGCLVEKSADTIYFSHRSLQEFLVSEHLINSDLLAAQKNSLGHVLSFMTPELIEFMVDGVAYIKNSNELVAGWFGRLVDFNAVNVPVQAFNLFIELSRRLPVKFKDPFVSPWSLWLEFFRRNQTKNFSENDKVGTFNVLADLTKTSHEKSTVIQAAAAYAVCKTLRRSLLVGGRQLYPLAAMINVPVLKAAIRTAHGSKNRTVQIRRDDNFLMWAFLTAMEPEPGGQMNQFRINLETLQDECDRRLRMGFEADPQVVGQSVPINGQDFLRSLRAIGVDQKDVDALRPFFYNEALRKAIRPLEVVSQSARATILTG